MNLRRRTIVLGAGLWAAAQRASGQTPGRSVRIGWIGSVDVRDQAYSRAFVQRLGELGFEEGRNLMIDHRHAGGQPERLAGIAAEMARESFDLLFAPGGDAVLIAAKQASRDAPIVIVAADYDPVAGGHVQSLARPGGRITGVTLVQSLLPAKRLELLRDLLPQLRRVAVFGNEGTADQLGVLRGAADRLGIALHVVDLGRPPIDFEAGFADAERAKPEALVVLGSAQFIPGRRRIPELALRAGLPSVFSQLQWVEAGGLLSYGISFPKMWRRSAEMAAAILDGVRAGDMPIELATQYELALNQKTAQALRIAVPPALQARVDRLVE